MVGSIEEAIDKGRNELNKAKTAKTPPLKAVEATAS